MTIARTVPRRGLFGALCFVLLLPPLWAQDAFSWGGSLSTTNSLQQTTEGSDDDPFSTTESLSLFLRAPFATMWSFTASGKVNVGTDPLVAADLTSFVLAYDYLTANDPLASQETTLVGFSAHVGRLSLQDPTALALNHLVDGIDLSVTGRITTFQVGLGYTGLIQKDFSGVSMSLRDALDDEDEDRWLGARRVLGRATLAFPNLVVGQNLTVGLAFQQDMRKPSSVVSDDTPVDNVDPGKEGGLLNTQYAVVSLDGPIVAGIPLYYGLSYILNTGQIMGALPDDSGNVGRSYQYASLWGHLAELKLRYFMPRVLNSFVSLSATFTSGDKDYVGFVEGNTKGDATMFTPITASGKGAVFGLEGGNTTIGEVSFGTKPFSSVGGLAETLSAQLSLFTFFRSGDSGPVSSGEVDGTRDGAYLGSEVDVSVRWRPFSDVGVGLTTGFLFANGEILTDQANEFDYMVRLDASLSF